MDVDNYLGAIGIFAGNFPPKNWTFCNGQVLSIMGNEALFSLFGNNYGGDGRVNFGLPDLRGRAAMHAGSGPGLTPRSLGEWGGSDEVTLTQSNIPAHNHAVIESTELKVRVADEDGNVFAANNNPIAAKALDTATSPQDEIELYVANPTYSNNNELGGVEQGSYQVLPSGESTPTAVNIMMPYLVLNFCVALKGTYPSRN